MNRFIYYHLIIKYFIKKKCLVKLFSIVYKECSPFVCYFVYFIVY